MRPAHCVIVFAVCLLDPPAVGASSPPQTAPRIRFEAMDTNRDGVISRDEWRGSARAFTNHDWNGDGKLSGAEVRLTGQDATDWTTVDHSPGIRERVLNF